MAAIKVHGSPLSTATQRVLACLYEKEVEFQFVPVDLEAGEHKLENFLCLNPFGEVPAFEEGDFKLFESRAITQYIAHEYADKGTQLLLLCSNKDMAVLQLWKEVSGTPACPATMRVLASLFEHGLDFDFISIDLKAGDHMKESFLSLSPFGQVPVYQDDQDLTLFESRAIMRFISHHYPKPGKEQVYEAPKQQGIVAAWIDVEDHQFNPPASKLREELLEKSQNCLSADKQVVAQEEANLAGVLDVYEERLQHFNYLGGDKFTSADLTHLPNLYYLTKTPAKRLFDARPHVSAWCTNLLARPAWAKVVDMVEKK